MAPTPPSPPGGAHPDEMRRLVDQVAEREAAEGALPSRTRPRGRATGLFAVVAALAMAVAGWNVYLVRSGTPPLAAGQQEAALAGVLYVLSVQLDQWRGIHGSYPSTLDGLAPPLRGVTYRRTENGYEISAASGGVVVTHRSDQDARLLAALAATAAGRPR